ncbi:hypothetical protein A5630_14620 [Mycolicibacterium mucogenicum]|uniref:Uncharacterized protein n=2 Tax=Mycolicibacterium mucogenicum TaxID=56689 RepID=A0A1A3HA13_MYCMU|nr:hypothetical protein A5630_14620 [Mycolicibacterium mucogenicum]
MVGEPPDFALNLRIVQGKARRGPRSIPVDAARGNHVLINRHEEVTMYQNTHIAKATVSVVAGALVALGTLGSASSTSGFAPASDPVATGHSCDVVVVAHTLCQSGQHRHGTSPTVGRAYWDLNSRPTA